MICTVNFLVNFVTWGKYLSDFRLYTIISDSVDSDFPVLYIYFCLFFKVGRSTNYENILHKYFWYWLKPYKCVVCLILMKYFFVKILGDLVTTFIWWIIIFVKHFYTAMIVMIL